ncbi:MAG TPA: hypothetical protein VNL91_04245 [Thermoanaerobaculia bacterium]|nr:hypothetical protein [Thermoanaerobaculia bacterium]
MLRKILAYLLGHATQLQIIAASVYKHLGRDIFTVSEQVRRERIIAAVKAVISSEWPEYAPYAGVVIDFVVAKVRAELKRRQGR